MALQTRRVTEYVCDYCGSTHRPLSSSPGDVPTGYVAQVKRITAGHDHSETPVVWLCSKDCLLKFMQFKISATAVPLASWDDGNLRLT